MTGLISVSGVLYKILTESTTMYHTGTQFCFAYFQTFLAILVVVVAGGVGQNIFTCRLPMAEPANKRQNDRSEIKLTEKWRNVCITIFCKYTNTNMDRKRNNENGDESDLRKRKGFKVEDLERKLSQQNVVRSNNNIYKYSRYYLLFSRQSFSKIA